MKATLETVTGVTINRDIDTADSPMGIIRKFYEEDATAATQIFSNQKAIDQLMDGHIDEAKSAFELLSIEGDSIKADWKTALCNQPAIKEEILSEYHMYGFLRRHHAHFRKPVQCQNVCSRDLQQL